MKNRLVDLNNYLFEQIEALLDKELTDDELKVEILRARSITEVASQIIENGKLALSVQKALGAGAAEEVPSWLENRK